MSKVHRYMYMNLLFLRIFTFEKKKIVQNYNHNCVFMPVINKHGLVRALIIVTSNVWYQDSLHFIVIDCYKKIGHNDGYNYSNVRSKATSWSSDSKSPDREKILNFIILTWSKWNPNKWKYHLAIFELHMVELI